MYPHFMEVHDGSEVMIVNIDKIGIIRDSEIMVEHPVRWMSVDESYEELKQMIDDAGCSIVKADPRLDNKPLTMDDLRKMIGEPVWNCNRRQWALVVEYITIEDGCDFVTFRPYKDISYEYGEDDLIKYPMYRMKVTE